MSKMFCSLQEPYFSDIHDGRKTVEARINDGKFRDIRAGCIIAFTLNTDASQQFTACVEKRVEFKDFAEMVRSVGRHRVIPHAQTDEEAIAVYEAIYRGRSLENGVVAFILSDSSET